MIINFSNLGGGGGGGYVLPIASDSTLGGIKVGQNLTIDSGGTLNAVGGEQDYQIVTGITDYSAGKMYAVVDVVESGTTEFIGNPSKAINCGSVNTHFYGEVSDPTAKFEFNPWLSGSGFIIDAYILKNVGDSYPTFKIIRSNVAVINETLQHNIDEVAEESFNLSAVTAGGVSLSGITYKITFSGDNSITVDMDGSQLYEIGANCPKSLWNYNVNMANCSGSTTTDIEGTTLNSLKYTDGESAYPMTFIESNSMVGIVNGTDYFHKRLRPYQISSWPNLSNVGGYSGNLCFSGRKLWVLYDYTGATKSYIFNETTTQWNDSPKQSQNVILYYSLPSNQILWDFNFKGWSYHRYVSYNNGVFSVWEDDQMSNLVDTFNNNSDKAMFWDNVAIRCYDGVISITTTQCDLEISNVGNWWSVTGNHWEPYNWLDECQSIKKYRIFGQNMPLATSGTKGAVRLGSSVFTDNDGKLGVAGIGIVDESTAKSGNKICAVGLNYFATTDTVNHTLSVDLGYLPSGFYTNDNIFVLYLNGSVNYQVEIQMPVFGEFTVVVKSMSDWSTVASGSTSGTGTYNLFTGEEYAMDLTLTSDNELTIEASTLYNTNVNGQIPVLVMSFGGQLFPLLHQ